MPEDLSTLTQKQLKGRKAVASKYKSTLVNEVTKIDKYIAKIDVELNTNPTLPKKPYSNWTRSELEDARRVYTQALMRSKLLDDGFSAELKEIDKSIMNL